MQTKNHKNIRLVTISRKDTIDRTLIEHPKYLGYVSSGDPDDLRRINYDMALIRLVRKYDIPIDFYNQKPINSVCLFSSQKSIKSGCLGNVYFSGFGKKNDKNRNEPTHFDYVEKLTYTRLFRQSHAMCKLTMKSEEEDLQHAYCYSTLYGNYEIDVETGGMVGPTSIGSKDEDLIRSTPDFCQGDSGGPFVYYMKVTESQDPNDPNANTQSNLQPGYRALQLSTNFGILHWGEKEESQCEGRFSSETITKKHPMTRKEMTLTYWFKGVAMGPKLYHFIDWISKTMFDVKYSDQEKIDPFFNDYKFQGVGD